MQEGTVELVTILRSDAFQGQTNTYRELCFKSQGPLCVLIVQLCSPACACLAASATSPMASGSLPA